MEGTLWVLVISAAGGLLFMLFGDKVIARLVAPPVEKGLDVVDDEAALSPRSPRTSSVPRAHVVLGVLALVVVVHLIVDLWPRRRSSVDKRLDDLTNAIDDVDTRLRRLERGY